jgi:thiosulfate reductase cytochrome b subunit
MKRLVKKHPLAIRWCHWLNFPFLAIMLWSGVLIYWAHDAYIPIPPTLAERLHVGSRLAEGMAWHFTFAWFFLLNGLAYVLYVALSGEWRDLLPGRRSLREAFYVVLHDLGLRRESPPRAKFNAAQRIAYTGVILMGAGSLLSGFAIYKPTQLNWLAALMGGYPAARLWHFLLAVGYVAFFGVHIAQVIRTGWNNFRAMLTGYEVVQEEVVPS